MEKCFYIHRAQTNKGILLFPTLDVIIKSDALQVINLLNRKDYDLIQISKNVIFKYTKMSQNIYKNSKIIIVY